MNMSVFKWYFKHWILSLFSPKYRRKQAELRKNLMDLCNALSSVQSNGTPLVIESLSPTMDVVTFDSDHVLLKDFKGEKQ